MYEAKYYYTTLFDVENVGTALNFKPVNCRSSSLHRKKTQGYMLELGKRPIRDKMVSLETEKYLEADAGYAQ